MARALRGFGPSDTLGAPGAADAAPELEGEREGLFRSVGILGASAVSVSLVLFSMTTPAWANEGWNHESSAFESVGVRGGIGFTDGPDAFLAAFDIEGLVTDAVGVGLGLQLGVDDDFVLVTPTLFSRYRFSLRSLDNERLRLLRPFLQLGLGIAHIDVDGRGRDRDGTDFLVNAGGGFDYPIDDHIELGTRMLIDVIPGEVVGQRIYFSWELITVRYRW